MTGRNRFDEESERESRRRVVAAAEAVLRGDVGIIEGAQRLSSLASAVVDDWFADPEFTVFGVLDTETDHLPVGRVREFWDPAALKEKDATVQRIEAGARSEVEAACRRLIIRFRDA
jgi:hypothetical protein